jgi:hypothetical protein
MAKIIEVELREHGANKSLFGDGPDARGWARALLGEHEPLHLEVRTPVPVRLRESRKRRRPTPAADDSAGWAKQLLATVAPLHAEVETLSDLLESREQARPRKPVELAESRRDVSSSAWWARQLLG